MIDGIMPKCEKVCGVHHPSISSDHEDRGCRKLRSGVKSEGSNGKSQNPNPKSES